MNIPNTVKIGWRNYIVKQVDTLRDDNGQPLIGEIKYDFSRINLNCEYPDDIRKVTLLHEIIHGIFCKAGHTDWRINEDLVDVIAEGLYEIILDNPEIFSDKEESLKIAHSCITSSGCCG